MTDPYLSPQLPEQDVHEVLSMAELRIPGRRPVISTADKAAGLYCAAVLAVSALGTCALQWWMATYP